MFNDRVLSGMRPTGRMHIGHYHGALRNWIRLQEEHECLFFAADWHALTTHFDETESISRGGRGRPVQPAGAGVRRFRGIGADARRRARAACQTPTVVREIPGGTRGRPTRRPRSLRPRTRSSRPR